VHIYLSCQRLRSAPYPMDPLYVGNWPERCGLFARSASVSLHYELRGNEDAANKALLVMGACATRRHFEQLADTLASAGVEVLSYDHRGIGRSKSTGALERRASQTSEVLAADALALLDHVWPSSPPGSCLHVYGASMGGMVAQRLALLLLARPHARLPLRSVTLSVTARCYGRARFVPLGAGFYRAVLPLALPKTADKLVETLLPKCFGADFLAAPHPTESSGATMGELWRRRWVAEFDDWWSLRNVECTAAQATVAGRHFTTSAELATLRECGVPILVSIAEKDELIAPHAQKELARLLGARTLVSTGGHMGSVAEFGELRRAVAAHMLAAGGG